MEDNKSTTDITESIEETTEDNVVDDSSSTTNPPSSEDKPSSIPLTPLTPAKPIKPNGCNCPPPIPGGVPPLPYPPNFCGTGVIPPAPYSPSFVGDPYYYWFGRPQIMDIYGHVYKPTPIRVIDPPNGCNVQNVARPYNPKHDDDDPLYNEINRPITEEDLTVINIDSKIIPTLKLKIYRINKENDSELILEIGKKYVVRYLTRIGLDTVVGKLLTFKASQNETRHINSYEQNDGDSYFIRLDCSTEGNSKIVDVLLKNLRSIKEYELPKDDDDNKDDNTDDGSKDDNTGDGSGNNPPKDDTGDNPDEGNKDNTGDSNKDTSTETTDESNKDTTGTGDSESETTPSIDTNEDEKK